MSSRTSSESLDKPTEDSLPSQTPDAMDDIQEKKNTFDVDDAPSDAPSPGGFTLLMTVTALAMSMFLVSHVLF